MVAPKSTEERHLRTIILSALISLTACGGGVSSLGQTGSVKVAFEKDVADCEVLSDIHGFNVWGGIWTTLGFRTARDSAMAEADGLGATDVVWTEIAPAEVVKSNEVHGIAYRCPEQ